EGKLVPQNPDEEPVNRLLERIRTEEQWKEHPTSKHGSRFKVEQEEDMPSNKSNSKIPLLEVLRTANKPLLPQELFSKAGYEQETIDDFYAALKKEVQAGRVR